MLKQYKERTELPTSKWTIQNKKVKRKDSNRSTVGFTFLSTINFSIDKTQENTNSVTKTV